MNSNDYSEMFSNRIKTILKEKNMTQKQLAEKTGITEVSISRYVNGDRAPKGPAIIEIAKALGVDAGYLLDFERKRWRRISGGFTPGGDPCYICPKCQSSESIHVYGIENRKAFTYCPHCGERLDY